QQHLLRGGGRLRRVGRLRGLLPGTGEDRLLVEVDGQGRVLDAGGAQGGAPPRGRRGEQQQRIVVGGHRRASSRTDRGRPPSSRARRWKSRTGVPELSAAARSCSQTRWPIL